MKERIIVKFRALRHLVGAVLALTVVLGTAGTAVGHSQLIDSTPGADESLDTAPSEVELEFNEEVNERGVVLMVVDVLAVLSQARDDHRAVTRAHRQQQRADPRVGDDDVRGHS